LSTFFETPDIKPTNDIKLDFLLNSVILQNKKAE
jgi:hypothetical protein